MAAEEQVLPDKKQPKRGASARSNLVCAAFVLWRWSCQAFQCVSNAIVDSFGPVGDGLAQFVSNCLNVRLVAH
jgi:hypothetical protein